MHAEGEDWEELVERLSRLPANHLRVVVAQLEVFARELRELVRVGALAADERDVSRLEQLASRLRGEKPRRNWRAVLALLEVQLEEMEPRKLSGYGPLSPEQENALRDLLRQLQNLLARAH